MKLQQITRNLPNFYSFSLRKYSTHSNSFKEVTIPVPWGHVAGKWWGPTNKRPILTLHGWQDNCASFDRLIPLLDKNVSFLCIDMPGHGYSSRIPSGVDYHFNTNCTAIRFIIEHYKWPKVSFMGHSLGGLTSYAYGLLYPEQIDFCIYLDGFQPGLVIDKGYSWRKYFNEFFKYEQQERDTNEPPSYTMEEIRQRISQALENSVNYEHSLLMAERNTAPSKVHPGKYYFTRDPRVKAGIFFSFSDKTIELLSRDMKFPFLVLKAKDSSYFGLKENFYALLDDFKKNKVECDFHYVEGNHHVHLNQPENVAGLINDFIRKMNQNKESVALN